ncbi:Bardet-Biedl syndrome 5 -like protein [Halotydeus destructor]|nr:Bardet-Biedl syndrome 5 -like protein [Halotydeus destructor]
MFASSQNIIRLRQVQVSYYDWRTRMAKQMLDSIKMDPLWEDRDIRFDSAPRDISLRKSEVLVDTFDFIEDTKGNAGDVGKLSITNLRMIWQSRSKPRINLSVGLSCVTSIANRTLHNKLRGKYDALHLMTKVTGTRYEFLFTQFEADRQTPVDVAGNSNKLTEMLTKVCKAYASTKLFRDLKLRSAIISTNGKQLKTLTQEQIYNKITGVWNLSSDQGNLGTMYVTNVRVVWHANMNELFNVSLPYIQINGIKLRESKFGVALVIESTEASGGYVLGFRIDPADKLQSVHSELLNLYNVHASNPSFGVELALDAEGMVLDKRYTNSLQSGVLEDSEFVEDTNEGNKQDTIAAYIASGSSANSLPVYCPELGLAIEKIKDGFTIESLWNVIPPN